MDLQQLGSALRSGTGLWVRHPEQCTVCGEGKPQWVLIRMTDGELHAEWTCTDCSDPSWDPHRFQLKELEADLTLIVGLTAPKKATCTLRPHGINGPRCGNPEDFLVIYLFGTRDAPDAGIRTAPACAGCLGAPGPSAGEVLVP